MKSPARATSCTSVPHAAARLRDDPGRRRSRRAQRAAVPVRCRRDRRGRAESRAHRSLRASAAAAQARISRADPRDRRLPRPCRILLRTARRWRSARPSARTAGAPRMATSAASSRCYTTSMPTKRCGVRGPSVRPARSTCCPASSHVRDAGHILGSASVALTLSEGATTLARAVQRRHRPVRLTDPARSGRTRRGGLGADGKHLRQSPPSRTRGHAARAGRDLARRRRDGGNIVMPAFAVGRSQDILYELATHYDAWQLADWQIFLDSPMAIEASRSTGRTRSSTTRRPGGSRERVRRCRRSRT